MASYYVNPYGGASFGNAASLNAYRGQVSLPKDPGGVPYVSGNSSNSSWDGWAERLGKGLTTLQAINKALAPVRKINTSAKTTANKKPATSTVARRLGVSAPAAPVAPPVDPLDTLRNEYSGYLTNTYGGLETALQANADQYKTRSQEIADRLKAQYSDAAGVAANQNQATQSDLEAFAQRMGLQQATQGTDARNWISQNERLKTLNAAAQANSLSTNDLIRSNYYDFLVNRVGSAKGAEATAQANLLDLVAQAKAQRLLMQQQAAAAAAAARRSSGGRRGGGGGSSSSGVKTSDVLTTSSTNPAQAAFLAAHPELAQYQMLQDTGLAAYVGVPDRKVSSTSSLRAAGVEEPGYEPYSSRLAQAMQYYNLSGKGGGAVQSYKSTSTKK